MQTETKEPLYVRLNKERTQGILEVEDKPFFGNRLRINVPDEIAGLRTIFVMEDYTDNKLESKANAEYTVLAVNNLHVFGEFAEWVIKEIENTPDELSDALLGMIKIKAKQVLQQIS